MRRGVAPRAGQEAAHLLPRADGDAADVDVLVGPAGEHVQRRVVPQLLLGGAGGIRRGLPRREQRGHGAAQRMDRGLVPRVQQQDRRRRHLAVGQGRILGLRAHEVGQQALARRGAHVLDALPDIGREGRRGLRRALLVGACPSGLVHRDHRGGPGEQPRRVGVRHAEQARDGQDRHRAAIGGQQVEGRAVPRRPAGHLVQQAAAGRLDPRGQRGDPPRGEGAQHQPPQAGVPRRLELEHRVALDPVERREVRRHRAGRRRLPSEAPVPQERGHRGVRGRHRHAVLLPPHHGPERAGARVERVGILHEVGIGRVLPDGSHPAGIAPGAAVRNPPPDRSGALEPAVRAGRSRRVAA